ncbi:chitin synthase [Aphelenchoides avenae]|nr:chitin synthase [Aphelenchus avenae]
MEKEKPKWDAFRSPPRSVRVQDDAEARYLYWLQWLKLVIFLFAHFSCLLGTLFSKSVVLLLATNIGKSPFTGTVPFYKQCASPSNRESAERIACLCGALWMIQMVPDICGFFQNLYRIVTKQTTKDHSIVALVVVLETCRAAGLSIMAMAVFPLLDMPRCVLLGCSILGITYLQGTARSIRSTFDMENTVVTRFKNAMSTIPAAIMFGVVIAGVYLWILMESSMDAHIILPLAVTLSAVGYWEAWIDYGHEHGFFRRVFKMKYGMRKLNAETRMCASIFRFLCSTGVLYWALRHHDVPFGTLLKIFATWKGFVGPRTVFFLAFITILVNLYLRLCARFLAAMRLNLMTIGHPVFLSMPVLFLSFYVTCNVMPVCRINEFLQLFDMSLYCVKHIANADGPFSDYYVTSIWFIAYLIWSCQFINGPAFNPLDEIIESMSPVLNGLDICQSLVVFRFAITKKEFADESDDEDEVGDMRIVNSATERTVILYICATMWHETKNEMVQMIKSILKLDEEHAIRLAEKHTRDRIKFRLEAHIFFDDAWEDDPECGRIPNNYFKLLFELLLEMTNSESTPGDIDSRILVNTSYGGRVVFKLPAGTLMFIHLKDKKLIRHKKRWSQVMYMYYLLGHRIMDSHLGVEDRQLQADNTYILAIDGDSKFEPQAVIKLLHLMNTKSDIGCACGRIHPIGDGVMVWYQKFEYAIAHWFQKAAEHVFGCVLCAPGCFSLFRASALMDDNVMHKYTKTACEPRHFVQYDQGEDRWLSTLLLKQGYRIEYAAAADAETYAPEGFDEFFNQRRRWTPSSVANTLDLLADYKVASNNNASISRMYILYQMLVIGFSLLGPAIIFSMVVYAQVAAFAVDSTKVLAYNATPVCVFIATCFLFESGVQLFLAKVASVGYAFVMLAVLIATTQQIVLETLFSPTSAFVMAMVFIFMFASCVHPKEFTNIIYGTVFFLMIPATYVFLQLYSLINLNVINWGTREAVAKATGQHVEKENLAERWLRRLGVADESSLVSRVFFCFRVKEKSNEQIRALERRFERTERTLREIQDTRSGNKSGGQLSMLNVLTELDELRPPKAVQAMPIRRAEAESTREVATDPLGRRGLWMDCEYLQCCERGKLKVSEQRFWDQLIDKYLKPIESTKEEQAEIATGLAGLRNRIAFSIILLNGLLVLAVFLLQRHKEVLSFKLTPFEGFKWTKLNETTGKFELTKDPLKVDPLGLFIIFFLMGILVVQTAGMIIHRLNTLVEALHEVAEMEEIQLYSSNFKDYKAVLDDARQMIDTMFYDRAHGADGYVRHGTAEMNAQSNVLYKLQTNRDGDAANKRKKRTK